jgi:hypothetical protein
MMRSSSSRSRARTTDKYPRLSLAEADTRHSSQMGIWLGCRGAGVPTVMLKAFSSRLGLAGSLTAITRAPMPSGRASGRTSMHKV